LAAGVLAAGADAADPAGALLAGAVELAGVAVDVDVLVDGVDEALVDVVELVDVVALVEVVELVEVEVVGVADAGEALVCELVVDAPGVPVAAAAEAAGTVDVSVLGSGVTGAVPVGGIDCAEAPVVGRGVTGAVGSAAPGAVEVPVDAVCADAAMLNPRLKTKDAITGLMKSRTSTSGSGSPLGSKSATSSLCSVSAIGNIGSRLGCGFRHTGHAARGAPLNAGGAPI
jgi:hypothetical protein